MRELLTSSSGKGRDRGPGEARTVGKLQFALSDEQRQVEHLIDYSNTLTDSPWSYEGEVVAEKGGKSLRYDGRASWAEHHGDCVLTGQ